MDSAFDHADFPESRAKPERIWQLIFAVLTFMCCRKPTSQSVQKQKLLAISLGIGLKRCFSSLTPTQCPQRNMIHTLSLFCRSSSLRCFLGWHISIFSSRYALISMSALDFSHCRTCVMMRHKNLWPFARGRLCHSTVSQYVHKQGMCCGLPLPPYFQCEMWLQQLAHALPKSEHCTMIVSEAVTL
jgi:hypothetical protein